MHPEPDGESEDRGNREPPDDQGSVGETTPDQHRRARNGQGPSRSTKPCSTSSATPVAAPIPAHKTVVAMKPGTRKLTYDREPPVPMAPPNANRNMSRNSALWIVVKTMSCGVRTNLRTVRPATSRELTHNLAPVLSAARGTPGDGAVRGMSVMMISP